MNILPSFSDDHRAPEGETMDIKWVDGFTIEVKIDNGKAVIGANREGMLSLAAQLTALAEAAPGSHIHYDEHSSLEDGSAEMIIERTGPEA